MAKIVLSMANVSKASNFTVFITTALTVVGIAFGTYTAFNYARSWIFADEIHASLDGLYDTLNTSRQIQTLNLLLEPKVSAAAEDNGPFGIRLNREAPAERQDFSSGEILPTSLRLTLEQSLAPAKVLGSLIVDDAMLADAQSAELEAFIQRSELSRSLLMSTVQMANKPGMAATQANKAWNGLRNSRSFVVLTSTEQTAAPRKLVLLTDHGALLGKLNRVSKFSAIAIAVFAVIAFILATFLTWGRFSDRIKASKEIEFLAHHDPLTGLPNRAVFSAHLNEALRMAHVKAGNMAVMLIDVDKFKDINDTYGHGIGDIYLQIIAERLKANFDGHLVARLAGDEFAIILSTVSDVGKITVLAARMVELVKAPCVIEGRTIPISLSIGIARANDAHWRSSTLLHCADLALYASKHAGRGTFSWYTPEMDAEAKKRKEIEKGLKVALAQDQFNTLYQPQYSLQDNTLRGFEALIRWEHPTKGTISPELFIPVAEDSGQIEAIGDWVLFHACQEAAQWQNPDLRVAVNVSPAQFKPGITEKKIAEALQRSRLAPERLEIEITESLLISNTDLVIETLNNIRAMGVSVAMDDFGTGYSSLSYLSRFPFDKIKIDRSFVQNLGEDKRTDAVVASIVGLGRSLGVPIVAEGVETANQITLLKAAGCNIVQGYLLGRPGTAENVENIEPIFTLPGTSTSKPTIEASAETQVTANSGLSADEIKALDDTEAEADEGFESGTPLANSA